MTLDWKRIVIVDQNQYSISFHGKNSCISVSLVHIYKFGTAGIVMQYRDFNILRCSSPPSKKPEDMYMYLYHVHCTCTCICVKWVYMYMSFFGCALFPPSHTFLSSSRLSILERNVREGRRERRGRHQDIGRNWERNVYMHNPLPSIPPSLPPSLPSSPPASLPRLEEYEDQVHATEQSAQKLLRETQDRHHANLTRLRRQSQVQMDELNTEWGGRGFGGNTPASTCTCTCACSTSDKHICTHVYTYMYMYMYVYMCTTEMELPCPSGERCPLAYINFKDSACPAELPQWLSW